jgi:hypothetical protein
VLRLAPLLGSGAKQSIFSLLNSIRRGIIKPLPTEFASPIRDLLIVIDSQPDTSRELHREGGEEPYPGDSPGDRRVKAADRALVTACDLPGRARKTNAGEVLSKKARPVLAENANRVREGIEDAKTQPIFSRGSCS